MARLSFESNGRQAIVITLEGDDAERLLAALAIAGKHVIVQDPKPLPDPTPSDNGKDGVK